MLRILRREKYSLLQISDQITKATSNWYHAESWSGWAEVEERCNNTLKAEKRDSYHKNGQQVALLDALVGSHLHSWQSSAISYTNNKKVSGYPIWAKQEIRTMKSSKNQHGYYCLTERRSQSEFELHFEVLRIRSFLFSQSSPASASVAFMFTPTLSCCDTESPATQFLKPLLQDWVHHKHCMHTGSGLLRIKLYGTVIKPDHFKTSVGKFLSTQDS
jgi:hypothetical protein